MVRHGETESSSKLVDDASAAAQSTLHAIAIDAAIWGLPIISFDAMRQAFLRDAHAQYNDIVFWSKPADWRLRLTTPNASTHYVYTAFNTADGPLLIEVPPAEGAGLFGSILDAWQVPALDVGPAGADGGRGGTYFVMPPGYNGNVPRDHIPVHLATYNGYALLRAIPTTSTPDDVQRALALVHRLNIHPVGSRRPAGPSFIDMSGRMFDGIVRFDASMFTSLARMLDEEPPAARDAAMLRRVASLGIGRDQQFNPSRIQELLNTAAADAHDWCTSQAPTWGDAMWDDAAWSAASSIGPETGFTFEKDGELDVDARAVMYFLACAPPAKLGRASFYLGTWVDDTGRALSGDATYRLHVPPHVPARQFWAATVYEGTTAAFVTRAARVELGSHQPLRYNGDGSVDLYFGPRAPTADEANWLPTPPRQPWFVLFRFYGPEPALFDQSWRLPDVERI